MGTTKKYIEKLGVDVSLLGFGCMRYPTIDGKIDEEKAEQMLDEAYKAGVNYYDTAYPYHNQQSEIFTGRMLNKYPRESYYLATKLPCWEVKTLDDAKRLFEYQLERLDKDYVDFYLLHALHKERFENMRDLGVVEYFLEKKKEGKIRFLGFSFHDEYEVFEEIINYMDWDFCQIQLNYMDTEEQAGMKGYQLAKEKNVPLVIMEPIKGGLLASLPDEASCLLKNQDADASIASWAMRYVASLENVKVVLSGMSSLEQVKDNLMTFEDFKPLSDSEVALVDQVADILKKKVNNGCTGCNYCMPCPAKVNIPGSFKLWNRYGVYENKGDAIWHYNNDLKEEEQAKNCIKCGKCEKVCPQKIRIREDLENVQETFDSLMSE